MRKVIDDNLPSFFEKMGYKQSFIIDYFKLGVNVILNLLGAALFIIDRKYEMKEVMNLNLIIICSFIFLTSTNYLILKRFKFSTNRFYGINSKQEKIMFGSWTKRGDLNYHYDVLCGNRRFTSLTEFNKYFTEEGEFLKDKFYENIIEKLKDSSKKED